MALLKCTGIEAQQQTHSTCHDSQTLWEIQRESVIITDNGRTSVYGVCSVFPKGYCLGRLSDSGATCDWAVPCDSAGSKGCGPSPGRCGCPWTCPARPKSPCPQSLHCLYGATETCKHQLHWNTWQNDQGTQEILTAHGQFTLLSRYFFSPSCRTVDQYTGWYHRPLLGVMVYFRVLKPGNGDHLQVRGHVVAEGPRQTCKTI